MLDPSGRNANHSLAHSEKEQLQKAVLGKGFYMVNVEGTEELPLHTAVFHRNCSLTGHLGSLQLFDIATPSRLLGRTQLC